MPLDGHSYLVSQGWTGKGTGLRQGAISRPLAIPQKKNLAGLGKDRDEAFPFWDHLFSAAAKAIQLKVTSDDEQSDAESPTPEFKRTVTGILCNRRPLSGVSATTSGTSTPNIGNEAPGSNLLSIAKREAAKSSLYARFFRGPVLGPDDDSASTPPLLVAGVDAGQTLETSTQKEKGGKQKHEGEEGQILHKKRKREVEDDAERLQRKKERKEQKAKRKEERKAWRRERKAPKEAGEELSTEEMKRQERKRQKRALKEAKEVCQKDDDVILKKEKKEKKDTAQRIQEQTLPLLDGHPQARRHRPQPPEHDPEEGNKKKKRKQR